ncbi:MAG: flagellar protein FlbB [Proteobacteria bacterium]|nr:flagellar protein FlbB [Pseudomonadota bacterium]
MIKFARDFRLIPIVLLATICLFVLKVAGLVFDGGYTLADRMRAHANPDGLTITSRDSIPDNPRIVVAEEPRMPDSPVVEPRGQWAPAMFNFGGLRRAPKDGDVTGSVDGDKAAALPKIDGKAGDRNADNIVTGSSGGGHGASPPPAAGQAPAEPLKASDKPPAGTKLEVGNEPVPLTPGKINSPGERAILNRLQDRRESLDNRGKELDMRESLIKAAEKRLEAKVGELKDIESRIKTETTARDKEEQARLKGLVAMYENMKPKDAARIFDRLDLKILVDLSTAMKPVTMSAVLAQMTPEAAERLTVELATRASAPRGQEADNLPKIEGSASRN